MSNFDVSSHMIPGIYLVATSLNLVSSVDEKIESFATLKDGWDYGSGGPLSARLREQAHSWASIFQLQFHYVDAFPGRNKITLAAGIGEHYIEFIIEETGDGFRYGVAYDFKRKQKFYKTRLPLEEAVRLLQVASGEIWKLSTSSIQINTMPGRGHLYGTHSQITMEASQSLTWPAQTNRGWEFVGTLQNTTDTWVTSRATPQFFGDLTPMSSRKEHNLTMRMSMRRFTRLTNAFSKKIDNHCHALALYFVWYNFVRLHKAHRVTPAMAAGLTNTVMDVADIVAMVDEIEAQRSRKAA